MLLILVACTSSTTEYSALVEPLRGNRDYPELDTGEPIVPPEDTDDPDTEIEIPNVVLNEIMSNNRSFEDPWNELSDWVEIYNGTDLPVALSSIMLSDSSGEAWIGSSGAIDPGGYYVVYANNGESTTGAPFALDSDGDTLTLVVGGVVTDRIATGELGKDVAWARIPDGGSWEPNTWITQGETNGDESYYKPRGDELFEEMTIYDIEIGLSQASYQTLAQDGRTTYVEGDVTINDEVIDPIGVRLRGSYTYKPLGQKSSFKLDFNRFEDLKYNGLQKLDLYNQMAYNSGVKEYSIYKLAEYMQIPVLRVGFARVSVNSEAYGFYMMAETYDDQWLQYTYGDDEGSMVWEPNYGDINGDFSYWDCEVGPCDTSVLTDMKTLLQSAASDANVAAMEQHMNIDNVLMMMAIELASGDWDGYCASHNFRVVWDAQTEKVDLTLSSMDLTLSGPTPTMGSCRGSVYTWCAQNTGCNQRWKDTLNNLADGVDEMRMVEHLEEVRDLIEADVTSQTKLPISQNAFDTEYDQVLAYYTALPAVLRASAQ